MGEALATHFVSKGWRVACVDIQRGPGEALAASLGPNAHFWETNVADYDSQARMFQDVFEKWGRVDALLANAGIVDKSSIYILNHRGNETYVDPCRLCLNRVEKFQYTTSPKSGLH
jgi:NAD(P)-dependent dehydrogenase (short-subunit alcohol dehydrogenase family)